MNNFRVIRTNILFHAKQKNSFISINSIFPQSFLKITDRFGDSYKSLHTTAVGLQTPEIKDETAPEEKKFKNPVDWLPFKWDRRPRFNVLRESGDSIRENTCDLSLPKPDFELSDELKSASNEVKHDFSLATGSKGDMRKVCERQLLKRIQRHPNDFSSLEVKIALKTITIRSLFVHHAEKSRWERLVSRVRFPQIIQKRNQWLKELRNIDEERFQWLLDELKLTFVPQPLDVHRERYCKKWDLRRLTKEYCEKMVADKKAAYHEELKAQQAEFLEEKKQILAWIEEEEKAIKALNV